MSKKIKIQVQVENDILLENPKDIWFVCNLITPLGEKRFREYNSSECIVVRKAYAFSYQGKTFGTFSFRTLQDFINYINDGCGDTDDCCYLTYVGCYITFNGNRITLN